MPLRASSIRLRAYRLISKAGPEMAYLRALGCYLPSRVVDNAEVAGLVGVDPAWLLQATGIEQRRFAAPDESVATMGAMAAKDCLESVGVTRGGSGADPGFQRDEPICASRAGVGNRFGPGDGRHTGDRSSAGQRGVAVWTGAGGRSLASLRQRAGDRHGDHVARGPHGPAGRDTAILFGDGAGACLVSAETGFARIVDWVLHSDGEFADALRLEQGQPIQMDGRTIILQAARKLPRVILEVLERGISTVDQVGTFLMHQANLNLITRVAQALGVPESQFFRNVSRYGNTSSASMLIAATEWWREAGRMDRPIVLAAFGAGLNWGAMLAR